MTVSNLQAAGADSPQTGHLPGERAYDAAMMRLALDAAEEARGATSPNPLVGAVIVDESAGSPLVLAVGFHASAGQAHAEVDALQKLKAAAGSSVGKTLYVTLEPCNHIGRTGKCSDAIVAAGLRRVVVGMADPNPSVTGGGMARLQAAGIEVVLGVSEAACRQQNRAWLRWLRSGRPQMLLKAAVSLDGRLAPGLVPGPVVGPRWLTGELARRQAHRLRAHCDAILVGAGTVLADDPQLTVRLAERRSDKQPLRVVLDGALRVPASAKLATDGTLLLTSESAYQLQASQVEALRERGVEVIALPPPSSKDVAPRRGCPTDIDLHAVLRLLGQRNILHALCEGGGILHGALLEAGLYDEVALFVAPLFLGDAGVPLLRHLVVPDVTAASWLVHPRVTQLGHDLLIEGELRRGGFSPASVGAVRG
jgi:diaminohydroxyphosphoribosylaminopyrimidine deaminase/5-amino-6-(5-phosphoribosylamino)uracil reductase